MEQLVEFLKARINALETKTKELENRVTELENEKLKSINVIEFENL